MVITSAAGSGGTTFARTLAELLDVRFVELDAIYWQPGWAELDADELPRRVEPSVADDG